MCVKSGAQKTKPEKSVATFVKHKPILCGKIVFWGFFYSVFHNFIKG